MDDINKQYADLCSKVGDLYFVRESLKSQLDQADAALTEAKVQREKLHAAFVAAQKEASSVVENKADGQS